MQELTETAWAFTTANISAPALLNPLAMLDVIEARGFVPQVIYYDMSMQGLARKGDIEAGFNLLDRAEANGLLIQCDQSCFRGDFYGTARAGSTRNRYNCMPKRRRWVCCFYTAQQSWTC